MDRKRFSRREFLRISAVTAAGVVAASCGAKPAPTATKPPEVKPTTPPPAKEVVLEAMTIDEYQTQYQEVWNLFNSKNPGIKVETFAVNEDMAAAHNAKVAGGWLPAIELTTNLLIKANKDNYQMFLDLSTFEFPWWDKFTIDMKNTWPTMFKLPGPRTLNIFQGITLTWMYRTELMEKAGFNPRKDVKTFEDLKKLLDEGAKWAKASPDVDYFWDQAWHQWAFSEGFYNHTIPLAFPDGQRQRQTDCWTGKAKFNAPDSPYRHVFEFYKEANDKGWVPERLWTRQWEPDMEGSYIGGKSVMMLHGPWPWDKMQANDPNVQQSGFPASPPAAGQSTWLQAAYPPDIDAGWFIRAGNEKAERWPQIKTAWNWFFSPEAIPLRAQIDGRTVVYKTDQPLELKSLQFQQVLKEIDKPGGVFENTKWENALTGDVITAPYLKKGAKTPFDWQSNNDNIYWGDYLSGKITLQQTLDIIQKNYEESFDLPLPL